MKYFVTLWSIFLCIGFIHAQPNYDLKKMQCEKLGRGVVALRTSQDSVAILWRLLREDNPDIAFAIYRNGECLTQKPLTEATFFSDKWENNQDATYEVRPVLKGKELDNGRGSYTLPSEAPIGYLEIPLNRPGGGTTPDGRNYNYSPNDASIGDVDGDGEMEIILKWDPSNSKDNSHSGYTGNVLLDCYRLDGTQLWRIDLGRNIRAGAHYTQFMVYDLDGDNKAEIVLKTADGTIDGQGHVIGDLSADYRTTSGRILEGPEYLTVFNGFTGKALYTCPYDPPRGNPQDWGDRNGNRSDRFLACVAYLDGVHPSVVMCRGYYTRTVLAAWQWDGKKLKKQWVFDTNTPEWKAYAGQGNHNLRAGDVDGDGCDEIIYGSMAVDHNGKGLYSTRMGHGDALHLTAFDPSSPRLQVWDCHENRRDGSSFRDAATGEVLFQIKDNTDVGRCMAADIDPSSPGVEMWSSRSGGVCDFHGKLVGATATLPINMAVWWDGDLLRELLDHVTISKYDYKVRNCTPLLVMRGCTSNNGTKANPCLAADILGDWREEVLMRTEDNSSLRLYITPIPTTYRFPSFLQDPIYRLSVVTQNVAYNQPCQPGFYFGPDMEK